MRTTCPCGAPKTAIIDQIRVLVTNRKLRNGLQRKVIQTPTAHTPQEETIAHQAEGG